MVALFHKTARMVSHVPVPMQIEIVFNNLFDASANQSEWSNSVWNRGLMHYKVENILAKKKEPFSWSFSFWAKGKAVIML